MPGDLALRFRLFGFPVSVSLFFVLIAAVLGSEGTRTSVASIVSWVGIVFVSVLLHELGHAFAARSYGQSPSISLHGLGGLTSWQQRGEMTAGRRLMVALAGPVAGLAFAVTVAVVGRMVTASGTEARAMVRMVFAVNVFWGFLNLIPMLPLDGGSVMAAVFDLVAPGRGRRAARYVSIVVALAVGAFMVAWGSIMFGLLCGLFIYTNVLELRRPPVPPSAAVIDLEAQTLPNEPPTEPPGNRPPGR